MSRSNKQKSTRPSSNNRSVKNQHVVPAIAQHIVPIHFQQTILDVFARAFPQTCMHNPKPVIQEVKGHLFNRDFIAAFSKPEYLQVYALRWSAARALAYTDIFARTSQLDELWSWPRSRLHQQFPAASDDTAKPLGPETSDVPTITQHDSSNASIDDIPPTKIACIGGGAGAEVVALAAVSRLKSNAVITGPRRLDILVIDIADWTSPIQELTASLTTPPPASPYASKATQDSAILIPFIDPSGLSVKFVHRDILDTKLTPHTATKNRDRHQEQRQHDQSTKNSNNNDNNDDDDHVDASIDGKNDNDRNDDNIKTTIITTPLTTLLSSTNLVTLHFTLNELFTTSIPKTTAFLLHLTDIVSPSSYLLVVDSPGSYSEVKLGGTTSTSSSATTTSSKDDAPVKSKRYPMKWLLDHTLLTMAGADKWEKLEDRESVWFRIPGEVNVGSNSKKASGGADRLVYPVELENMRYQIHLYRRL